MDGRTNDAPGTIMQLPPHTENLLLDAEKVYDMQPWLVQEEEPKNEKVDPPLDPESDIQEKQPRKKVDSPLAPDSDERSNAVEAEDDAFPPLYKERSPRKRMVEGEETKTAPATKDRLPRKKF